MEPYYSYLIFVGLGLKVLGFAARDELLLRTLVVTGLICDMVFYALHNPPIWQSVTTIATLVVVNVVLLGVILSERSTFGMSARDRQIYKAFQTLTPGQFKRVIKLADHHLAETETRVLTEGTVSDRLYFLETDGFALEKQGVRYPAKGPGFIGEIVFLQGGVASASVFVPQGARYVSWPVDGLKRLMKRRQPISNALVARFSADLAGKLAQSVPLPKSV